MMGSLPRSARAAVVAFANLRCVMAMLMGAVLVATPASAQPAQMDLRQAAGVPLPAADLPAGTVSVRVVRGSFANNLSGVTVVFIVDGQERPAVTDAGGRAQMGDLPRGARVRARAVVGDERLETQEITLGGSGIRFVLVASEPGTAASPAAPVSGTVVIGADSRIVIEYSKELLNVYYVLQILNEGRAPVDLGGPLVIELPAEARSATLMEGATSSATVSGSRVTVRGPFAPGRTDVNVAFTLPFTGDAARLAQRWPARAQSFGVFALKTGDMDLRSPQLEGRQSGMQQGQELVMGRAPALETGEVFALDITGLPHRPTWPRNLALGAAGLISAVGLWAAFGPGARRRPV